jgi:hypothetical protein
VDRLRWLVIADGDDFDAVAHRLPRERVIQVYPDFVIVEIEDRARQGFAFFGGEFDDQSRFQLELGVELDPRDRAKQGLLDIAEGEVGPDVDGFSAISPRPSCTVIGSSSKLSSSTSPLVSPRR